MVVNKEDAPELECIKFAKCGGIESRWWPNCSWACMSVLVESVPRWQALRWWRSKVWWIRRYGCLMMINISSLIVKEELPVWDFRCLYLTVISPFPCNFRFYDKVLHFFYERYGFTFGLYMYILWCWCIRKCSLTKKEEGVQKRDCEVWGICWRGAFWLCFLRSYWTWACMCKILRARVNW